MARAQRSPIELGMASAATGGGGLGVVAACGGLQLKIDLAAGVHDITAQLPRLSLAEVQQLLAAFLGTLILVVWLLYKKVPNRGPETCTS